MLCLREFRIEKKCPVNRFPSDYGVLFFNWRLLQLPVRLADYVIVHALVHLREPHHGPGFWESLARALPHWRQRKEELQSRAREFLTFGLGTLA